MSIYAIVSTLDAGYNSEKQRVKELNLTVGQRIPLLSVSMGQSSTTIRLEGYNDNFNSVFFTFEENGSPLDIYSDPRFNPYLGYKY